MFLSVSKYGFKLHEKETYNVKRCFDTYSTIFSLGAPDMIYASTFIVDCLANKVSLRLNTALINKIIKYSPLASHLSCIVLYGTTSSTDLGNS